MRILLVMADEQTALKIKQELDDLYTTESTNTGEKGEDLACFNEYDLVILDKVLPDINGIEVCRRLRELDIKTPILILTEDNKIYSKVKGLDSGADDCLAKPFNLKELTARIRALLRRNPISLSPNILQVNDLQLDLNRRVVKRANTFIKLRRKEFHILEYLIRNQGIVVTREMILDHVWESESESLNNIVDVHIKYLRDHIDKNYDKKLIQTIHGVGYKIED